MEAHFHRVTKTGNSYCSSTFNFKIFSIISIQTRFVRSPYANTYNKVSIYGSCSGKNHIFTEQPTSAAQQADYHLSPSSLSTIGVIPLNSLSISSSIPSSITCSRTNNYIMHFSYSSVFGQFLYACLSSSSNQITHILTPCIAHSAYK